MTRPALTEAAFRCQWVRDPDGTTTLIPGCWARVHDPDAECTCGEWSEETARETIRGYKHQTYRLAAHLQELESVLRKAGIKHPPVEWWQGSTARAKRRAMHKAISEAGRK
jgi:hypothetical protein